MIDFNQIRGLAGGQRYSFEELVCQLARHQPAPAGALFRRVEGAGGDGGVEAYWLMTDGTKVGYQAKFFTRTRDIDWAQIDDSVEQALKIHLTLTKYVVALPCNLTDRRGTTGKGKTGWELWDDHVAAWKRKWLLPAGRQIDFVAWTAFELNDQLTALSGQGLLRYWFGVPEFSSSWFADNVRLATASLDERYHPDDHVDVSVEGLFQFIVRHPAVIKKLRDGLADIKKADVPDRRAEASRPPQNILDGIGAAREALLSIAPEFELPCWEPWGLKRWKELADNLTSAVGELQEWAWNTSSALSGDENRKVREEIQYTLHLLHKLRGEIGAFENIIGSRYPLAEQGRIAVVDGRAGTGKSHLLGRMAEVALEEGYPVILLLGQQLGDRPLWEQITKRLGLGDTDPDVFLQALDAAAEASRKRGLILIDAVNEGAGVRLWKPELSAFIERIRRFRNLACILTCRTEYVLYVFPPSVLAKTQRITIRGFETVQEQVRAARIYMDRRGITRPSTPWLAPEFVNPLFLGSTCLALQRDGRSELPRGLIGAKEIFAFYIKSVARNLGAGRDGSNELVPPVTGTLRAISKEMASGRKDYISRGAAMKIANEHFRAFFAPQDQSWLDVLLRNGLLRTDPDPEA